MIDVSKISGIGEYTEKTELKNEKKRVLYYKGEKVFLVVNNNTIEVRTDAELRKLLVEKYESVMDSRYLARAGWRLCWLVNSLAIVKLTIWCG